MKLVDGGGYGFHRVDSADKIVIGGNIEINSGSRLVLPNTNYTGTVNVGRSLFNRGGLIYDGDVS